MTVRYPTLLGLLEGMHADVKRVKAAPKPATARPMGHASPGHRKAKPEHYFDHDEREYALRFPQSVGLWEELHIMG